MIGRAVERLLSRSPLGVPGFLVEAAAATARGLFTVVGHPLAEGVENRVRGFLRASRWRTTGLRLGRGVILRGARRKIGLGRGVALNDHVFVAAHGTRGRVTIGDNTHVDVGSVLYGEGGLNIGAGCALASGVVVYTQSNQYAADPVKPVLEQGTVYQAVSIGDDVWIGARAVVLPGVEIGAHAVVGAGAVVTEDVPAWAVVAGVPARILGDRREPR